MREAIRIHTEVDRRAPARLVPRAAPRSTRSSSSMEEGGFLYSSDVYADDLPYWLAGPNGPLLAIPYTLDANDMRFATRAGLQFRRPVLRLSEGQLRRALRRGRGRRAEDDVGRPALPARRPPRAAPRRSPASSTTCRRSRRSGCRGASTSPATGSRIIGRRADAVNVRAAAAVRQRIAS